MSKEHTRGHQPPLVRKEQCLEPWVQIRITFSGASNAIVAE